MAGLAMGLALLFASYGPAEAQERRFRGLGSEGPERRIALVVGNRSYSQGPLVTPENDAQDIAAVLRKLSFQVVLATNLDPTKFRSTIRRFEDMLAAADGRVIALVFYAGHGVQIGGKNYLLPTEVSYKDQRDVVDFGIDVDQLLGRIHAQEPEVTIMVLDACRDSPLPVVARSARSGGGLARMDPPAGTFVAFATSPGSTASDNQRERNGLFTKHILQHIQTPGLNTEQVFRKVRTEVYKASRGQQLPEDSNRLVGGDFLFAAAAAAAAPAPLAAPAVVAGAAEKAAPSREPAQAEAKPPPKVPPKQARAEPVAKAPPPARPPAAAAPVPVVQPPPINPPTLAMAQPSARPPVADSAGHESALARLLNGGPGSLVYAVTGTNGATAEVVARIGASPDVLLEFDGSQLTHERALREQAGLRFEPPLPLVKKDMAVGTSWTHAGKFRDHAGRADGLVDSSIDVTGMEDVASPWGPVRCFRMSEVRWVAGTRYDITRWVEVTSLIPLRERTTTVLSLRVNEQNVFVAPTLKPLVELRAINP